jgi:CheY-like chemotaxis protein
MVRDIMLVDDDRDDAGLFQEALNEVYPLIKFHSATGGREALEFLSDTRAVIPDMIFLDVNMPEINGWECLRELKLHPQLRQIPVVMYSTSALKPDKEKASALGAIGMYQKPVRFEELKDLLRSVIAALQV